MVKDVDAFVRHVSEHHGFALKNMIVLAHSVGGGHNALVSAAYLARAGLSVVVLERLGHTGGAAVSVEPFTGQWTRYRST